MKKILSLLLVAAMAVSVVPTALATNMWYAGTDVTYDAQADNDQDGRPDHSEAYTVTVPAQLAPGGEGNVVAQGTWASNRKLVVTADDDVTLTNSINAADQKVLDVTFPGIELAGSNTTAVTDTQVVEVANISDALFGVWSGTFEYNVEMVTETITFTIDGIEYKGVAGTTFGEWVNSEYNTDGYKINDIIGIIEHPEGNDLWWNADGHGQVWAGDLLEEGHAYHVNRGIPS